MIGRAGPVWRRSAGYSTIAAKSLGRSNVLVCSTLVKRDPTFGLTGQSAGIFIPEGVRSGLTRGDSVGPGEWYSLT